METAESGAEQVQFEPHELDDLPERFVEENLKIRAFKADELPDVYLDQIISKVRQEHVMENEGHEDVGEDDKPGRFRSREDYRNWAEGKDRYVYLITNPDLLHDVDGEEVEDVGGIIWFGPRDEERAPGYGFTFAIRQFDEDEEQGWGKYHRYGLGQPFMERTHKDIAQYFPEARIWLDYVKTNENAGDLYNRAGYRPYDEFVAPHGNHEVERVLMVNDMGHPFVPKEVEDDFFSQRFGGNVMRAPGIFNTTFIVVGPDGEPQILQRMSRDNPTELIADQLEITEKLAQMGWDMPKLRLTQSGANHTTDDDGNRWRSFEFVNNDTETDHIDVDPFLYGELLGRLNRALYEIDVVPSSQIPNYRDTNHHAQVLQRRLAGIPSEEGREIASKALAVFRQEVILPDLGQPLIHGDTKLDNFLLRDGKPFTIIDWDTVMIGSPWDDLGDLLRSVGEETIKVGREFTPETIEAVINGYYDSFQPRMERAEFLRFGYLAGMHITNELTMRFIADYDTGDDGWFTWDSSKFDSRADHNLHRSKIHVAVYETLLENLPDEAEATL